MGQYCSQVACLYLYSKFKCIWTDPSVSLLPHGPTTAWTVLSYLCPEP